MEPLSTRVSGNLERNLPRDVVNGLQRRVITLDKGRVMQTNFHQYEPIRMDEMPKIEVYLMPNTNAPSGLGEHSNPHVVPAITNAIFKATGKRLRELPVRLAGLA